MPKTTAKKTPSKRKPNAAFMKPVQPDEKLSAIVGSKPLPRSELTKKLWDYIKKNGLQDKKKRTQINADDAMRPVFNGKSQVSMFEMTKLVSGHLKKHLSPNESSGLTAGPEGKFFVARGQALPAGAACPGEVAPGTAAPCAAESLGEWFRGEKLPSCPLSRLRFAACSASPRARAEANWLTDFQQAQAAAKAGHKLLLLDFTGSDWCIWCRELEAEVFSQAGI